MQISHGRSKLKLISSRYIVITNKRFYYYYTDKDYKENKEPLGYFEMKNLYNLQILADYQYGSKKNIFTLLFLSGRKKINSNLEEAINFQLTQRKN